MQDALSLIFSHTPAPVTQLLDVASSGSVLRGCILAEDVHSARRIPFSHTTNVDGYAVRAADGQGTYQVWTSAKNPLPVTLPSGVIYRVNTGGPIPDGADAVVMVEDTEVVEAQVQDGKEDEKFVRILADVKIGENVRKPGSDVEVGDLVLSAGSLISDFGGELGTLHFVGHTKVSFVFAGNSGNC